MTRNQMIDCAELEFLVARRRLAQSSSSPELLPLAENDLRRAGRRFLAAGVARRAETVWRYSRRLKNRYDANRVETLEDAVWEWLLGHGTEGGDA